MHEITELCASSREAAEAIATAGLAAARERLVFESDGQTWSLESAPDQDPTFELATETIEGKGTGRRARRPLPREVTDGRCTSAAVGGLGVPRRH